VYFILAYLDGYDPGDDTKGSVVSTTLAGADDLTRLAALIRQYGYTPIKDRPWHYVCANSRLCVVLGAVESCADCSGLSAGKARKAANEIAGGIVGMSRLDLALFMLFDTDDMMAAL